MSLPLRFEVFPRTWEALSGTPAGAAPAIRVGEKRVLLSDVRSVSAEKVAERDNLGIMAVGILFVFAAAFLLHGVVVLEWRPRYLIGVLLLGGLGLGSVWEAMRATTQQFTRLKIETGGGEILYATASPADAASLAQALTQRE